MTIGQLTIGELQQELRRRVEGLQAKRAELMEQLQSVEQQLRSVEAMGIAAADGQGYRPSGGAGTGRKRLANAVPLKELLVRVLDERGQLTTREAADTVLERGYATTSRNFTNNVNVALNADDRFLRVNGKWALAEGVLVSSAQGAGDEDETDAD
jgi:hypothetical protein